MASMFRIVAAIFLFLFIPCASHAQVTSARPERHVRLTPTELQVFLLHHSAPDYPADAKAAHISGNVVMEAVISPEGKVVDLKVISGPDQLRQAAIDCAKTWTYRPYLENGEPISIDTTLTVNFFMMH